VEILVEHSKMRKDASIKNPAFFKNDFIEKSMEILVEHSKMCKDG